jgi:hypothetical protein
VYQNSFRLSRWRKAQKRLGLNPAILASELEESLFVHFNLYAEDAFILEELRLSVENFVLDCVPMVDG